MNWAEVISVVAGALADRELPGEDAPLAVLTGSAPSNLRRRLQSDYAAQHTVTGDIEPLIYQNELPVRLLACGIIRVAAQAVATQAASQASADQAADPRVTAIVALAALSTLRLDQAGHVGQADQAATLVQVHRVVSRFSETSWTQALDSLACRTAELTELLGKTVADRHQTWQRVTLEDRILAEAVAAAVVGGAASVSGLPARRWIFPFHLFCSLAVSAARVSASTIERWLRIEFLPAPLSAERTASLAVLIMDEASVLGHGCQCKAGIGESEIAYDPRGPCRQADHDLWAWRPGQPKPGSRTGARYASTLWGWQRRWLGGANPGGVAADGYPERLRSNDVASSVLARRWLSGDRGFGGPVMLYDRILPEFCLQCGSKVRPVPVASATGQTIIQRTPCCGEQQLVYQSEFSWRSGKRVLKPKLGIIVIWPANEGNSGYATTMPLGPLWICRRSGRYSLSERHCSSAECRSGVECTLEPVHHGWVLLPLSNAWADLKATGVSADDETVGSLAGGTLPQADLRFLEGIFSQLRPGHQYRFQTAADVWELAKGWSSAEMNSFMAVGKRHGLELLLRCKEITHG